MESAVGVVLVIAGLIINLIGGTMSLVAARRTGSVWFAGCLFGIGWPLFCLVHFRYAWKPLVIWLLGLCLGEMGTMMLGDEG